MSQPNKIPEPILEDFYVGELPLEQKHTVAEQLNLEPGGMNRLAELESSNEQILAQYPSRLIAAQISSRCQQADTATASRQWIRPLAWVTLVTGAALMLLIFVHPFGEPPTSPAENTQNKQQPYYGIKGDPKLIIHRKSGTKSKKMAPNDMAHEGDLLQLMYNAGGLKYGVIFSYDGAHSITLHYPASPEQSTAIEDGGVQSVDHSYELDDAPDFETFVFVGSNNPLSATDIIDAAKRQLRSGDSVSFTGNKIRTSVFTLKKPLTEGRNRLSI